MELNKKIARNNTLISAMMVLLVSANTAFSSPTSKEYVDKQIKEVLDKVQIQLTQQNKTIETRITRLQHEIGEEYQGGIVFWLDESKQHGLIAAKIDATTEDGIQWNNGESGDKTTNAKANGIFSGLSNTQLIIAEQTIDDQEGQFAALLAHQFRVESDGITSCKLAQACYGNWYLPSVVELQLLKKNLFLKGIGQWASGRYWSSTEKSITKAYLVDFNSNLSSGVDKSFLASVRPIHAF